MAGPGAPGGGGGGSKPAAYTPEQVAAAAAMAKSMAEMSKSATLLEASFKSQAESLAKMAASMKEFAGANVVANFTVMAGKMKEVGDAINGIDSSKIAAIGAAAVESGRQVNEMAGEVTEAGQAAEEAEETYSSFGDFLKSKFPAAAGAAIGAVSGLQQGFSNLIALGKGIGGFVSGLVGGLFNIGKSILSIPFKMFGSLMDMASQGGGGVSELAEAVNGLRKEFGSLAGPTNSAIMSVSKSMAGLGMSGGKTMQIFGNAADRIKAFTELLAGANVNLRSFTAELKENGGAILAYQKGLGLANESMEALAQIAKTSGQSMTKTLNNITKQSLAMGKAFGLDAKIISREMGKAAQDFKNFGNVSQKQLAVAVTYAQKLGLSLDKITGTMDSFGTFDDAAENVSKLNEAFGTNIDTMAILQAETPEEKMEILRKEMAKAGVQGEKLNAQQRKLIASAAGLSDEAAIAAFSTKNQGVELDKIKKVGDKAEKKTLTQAEAMEKLSDAMERMLKSGGGAPEGKGLLGTFLAGISKGITSSPEFIKMMSNIRMSLVTISMKGKELGKAFVQLFPGVKDIFKAIGDLFNPAKIGGLLDKVNGEFKKFFKDLTSGKASFKELMANLQKHFLDFFKSNSKEGGNLLQGFSKFFKAAGEIFAQAGEWLVEKLSSVIRSITEWIKKPKMPNIDPKSGMPLLSPFERIFKKAGELLWPALKDMGKAIFDKILTSLKDPANRGILMKGLGVVAAIVLGPALLKGLVGGIAGSLGGGAVSSIGGALTKLLGAGAGKIDSKKVGQQISQGVTAGAAAASQTPADQSTQAVPDPESTKRLEAASKSSVDWGGLMKFMAGFAGFMIIGLAAFKVALEIVKDYKIEDIIKAGMVMLTLGLTFKLMAPALESMQSMKDVKWGDLAKGLVAMGAFLLMGIGAFWLALKVVAGVPVADIMKAAFVLLAMVPVFMGAGIVVAEAAILGKFVDKAVKALVVGMVAIGIAVLAMIGAIWVLNEATEGVDPNQMKAAAMLLEVMSNTFMKAGVIIAEATLIGAAIISSAGIAAGAMAAGLAAMTAAVAAMAGAAIMVLKELDKLSGDPGQLKTKAEAFEAVMNAITNLMSKVGDIMDTVAGMTSIFNTAAEDQKNIELMTDFAGKIFAGMTGLVKTLLDGLKDLKPEQAEVAKAVGGVFQAVASLVEVVGGQMQSFQEETTSVTEWFSGKDPKKTEQDLGSAGNYMGTVMGAIGKLVTDLVAALSGVNASEAATLGAVGGAVGQVLNAVTGLIKNIMPDPKAFQKEVEVTTTSFGVFKDTVKVKEVDTDAMSATFAGIRGIIDALKDSIPPLIKALLSGIVDVIKTMNPQDIKALEPVGKMLDSITKLAQSMMPQLPPPPASQVEAGAINVVSMTATFPSMAESLAAIRDEIPKILTVLLDAAKTVGGAANKGLAQNIDILLKLFEVLPKLTGITKELGSFKTESGGVDESAGFKMAEYFRQIKYFLQYLFYGGKYDDGSVYDAQLAKIIDVLTNDGVTSLLKKVVAAEPEIKALGNLMDTLKKLVEAGNMASAFPGGKVSEDTGLTMSDTFKQIKYFLNYLFYGAKEGGDIKSGELSKIIELLTNAAVKALMTKSKELDTNVASLKGMFDSLKSLVEAANTVGSSFPKAEGGEEASKTISDSFKQVNSLLTAILGDGETGELPKIVKVLEGAAELPEKLTAGVTTLTNAGTTLPVFVDAVTMLQDVVTTNFDRIGDMGDITADITEKLKAINDMVAAIQEMENTLNTLPQINLSAGLTRVASMAGLGYGGVYTVTTKDVNVKIYLKVAMDVNDVEKVILSNNGSIIKEKINLLLDATPDDDTGKGAREGVKSQMPKHKSDLSPS